MPREPSDAMCVVLLRDGAELDDAAQRALRDRAGCVVVHRDPVETMADLCLRHRRGGPDAVVTTLVVAGTWPAALRLIDATQRYLPEIEILRADARGRLSEVAVAAPPGPPRGLDPAAAAAPSTRDDDDDPSRLTREEIDMLLAPLPDAPGAGEQ